MKKRLVSLLLSLCIVIGLLPNMIPEAKAAVLTEADFKKGLPSFRKIMSMASIGIGIMYIMGK